ncbi:MAG: hypothetical protein ISS94_05185 [Candidatus Syntrophoarchaeum sp.]|nr:hypothetical protein [Candidatus Syntrophoarchaeum sp.]
MPSESWLQTTFIVQKVIYIGTANLLAVMEMAEIKVVIPEDLKLEVEKVSEIE